PLDRGGELGFTCFDPAAAYGEGHSERLLGDLLRRYRDVKLVAASKVAPKNRQWPGRATSAAEDVFPCDHVVESTPTTLRHLGVESLDLQQLHVWDDSWTD